MLIASENIAHFHQLIYAHGNQGFCVKHISLYTTSLLRHSLLGWLSKPFVTQLSIARCNLQ